MNQMFIIWTAVALFRVACAESVLEIGHRLSLSQSTVEWKDNLEINMTCTSVCIFPCRSCSPFSYIVEKRNKTYVPNVPYADFRMYPVSNLTDTYTNKCTFVQTATIRKVQKNEAGTIRCKSPSHDGMAFLYIFYNVTFTNATLPTEVKTSDVDLDAAGAKVSVRLRSFNVTADGDNYPFVSCSLSGGSSSTVRWSRSNGTDMPGQDFARVETGPSGTSQVVSKVTFRSFDKRAAQIVGEYNCTIEDRTYRLPAVFSAPVVKMSDKDSRSSMEGDTMTQGCTVVAYPGASVIWTKDNQTLLADGDRIKFGGDNATLTITSLKQEDAGLYICTAENSLGLGQAYIKLRVKDRLAALWPFLGILAEVVILVTIILLYEKKRAAQKRNQEEHDAADVNKEEPNANDSDVRHRPVKT